MSSSVCRFMTFLFSIIRKNQYNCWSWQNQCSNKRVYERNTVRMLEFFFCKNTQIVRWRWCFFPTLSTSFLSFGISTLFILINRLLAEARDLFRIFVRRTCFYLGVIFLWGLRKKIKKRNQNFFTCISYFCKSHTKMLRGNRTG